ncbi:UNVERIFIED_CONTAM: hypothetical protein PYX00_010585 [Menopon gallinae]|uniref:Uncharacterized protein n=1 Tax=Menopon gallinae TaxID=328185 RepID=A0AAW2HFW3_9NEOP
MLWESDNKDDPNEGGRVPNTNPLHQSVTPVLVPMQSGTRTVHQTVPIVVPDVEELKEQFQQQQNMLTQIKETIKENESQLSSKGKQVAAYANRLSQIRARTKNSQGRSSNMQSKPTTPTSVTPTTKSLSKRPSKENLRLSKENLAKENDALEKDKTAQTKPKLSPKGKIGELKKRLEESKLKFEERTGKEVSETKKIESIVENLRMQLEERDVTIQELQKIVEQPTTPNVKSDNSFRKGKTRADGKTITSKSTQTTRLQQNDESIEIIALQNRIYELEANILDLEENLKEKESVIDARTQAVTLLSQDLSIKGKNTLECLEETRQEMRSMQNNFVIIENQLKKELVEKDDQLTLTEEKLKKLESINYELSSKNKEIVEELAKAELKFRDLESQKRSTNESVVQVKNDDKVAELSNRINVLNKELDDSNKSMIKMKLEHKHKIKLLNKTIEKLRGTSDDKAEILRLQTIVDEFEVVRESLQNKIAELEEEKVSEKKLKDAINELESRVQQQSDVIQKHLETISNLEREKLDLFHSSQDQNILIENLYAKIQNLESTSVDKESIVRDYGQKLQALEDEYKIKMETMESEHRKEIEMLESYYSVKAAGGDRKEFEEYRISNELNNVQVEEQIEMLIREKQQLLEKLKSLSVVSTSSESIAFETVDHSEFQGHEAKPAYSAMPNLSLTDSVSSAQEMHAQKITEGQLTVEAQLLDAVTKQTEKDSEPSASQLTPGSVEKYSFLGQISDSKFRNKLMMTLTESEKTIQEQNEKIKELNMKLEEKEQLIKNYIEKIELFEKDDWGRENDWKTTKDDFEHMQELQKKCLSLENSLIELTDDCERLRKENIELVHLLSEEKVKRKKLMEKLNLEDYSDITTVELEPRRANDRIEESVEVLSKSAFSDDAWDWPSQDLEDRVSRLVYSAEMLEERLGRLEKTQQPRQESSHSEIISNLECTVRESQEKLEWSNIVLTSKETEIFRLQNLLEDSSKTLEDLQRDLKETRETLAQKTSRLNEVMEEISKKEKQVEELSLNIEKLHDSMKVENERTSSNESQLKQLMETVKEMETDAAKKENELKEIQGILAEKNLDIHNLKQWLEQVNTDLSYGYKEHLENMDKCLRDKEHEYELLLSEKNELEEAKRNLTSVNEDICNQRVELLSKNEALEKVLQEKEKIIEELNEKLAATAKAEISQAPETEELKHKIKKLAANLKKKVQNEKDLLQQIKDHEEFLAEKDKTLQKLQQDFTEVNEKWLVEKSEKEQFKNEFAVVLSAKSAAEAENMDLKERLNSLETEYNNRTQKDEYKFQQMETQLQKMYEASDRMKKKQEHDKTVIANLEAELAKASQAQESEAQKENEELKKALAETCGKYEESKFKFEELKLDVSKLEDELERLRTDNTSKEAKIQEQLAVMDSLENELKQARDQMRRSEESLCFLEERRSSLESKTEVMLQQIEEGSKNAAVISDMSNQIQALIEAEQNLKASLKSLDERNKALESDLKELREEKAVLEKELVEARQRLNIVSEELAKLKEADAEKATLLSDESEKVKTLNMDIKQKSAEIKDLNQQIALLEADLQENVENSKSVERALSFKIGELLTEKAALMEKNNSLNEMAQSQDESKPVKRKKSVTFRTDETDYIRDLKSKIHGYSESLKKSNEEIEYLKMELFREKLRNEVSDVVSEAKEKVESLRSTPEKIPKPVDDAEPKFDAATFFGSAETAEEMPLFDQKVDGLGSQPQENLDQVAIDYDSLMWDDGWGTEGHLEEQYLSTQPLPPSQGKYEHLEKELHALEAEKKNLEEQLQQSQAKYAKAIKKMKEQKALCEKLQAQINQLKSDVEFGGLDGAMMDELKSQIRTFEQREKELIKNLETSKTEKDGLLKRIEVLNAGNEKFIELKERQNNEMELWEAKKQELQMEITELRNQLRTQGEGNANVDESDQLRELKNKVDGLEWENCELKELLEEKQELLEAKNIANDGEEKEKLVKEITELSMAKEELQKKLEEEDKKNRDVIGELQQQVTALATENETLQEILGEMKKSKKSKTPPPPSPTPPAASAPSAPPQPDSETRIFDYFKAAPANDAFSSVFAQPVYSEPVVEPVVERKVVTQVQANNDQFEKELQQLRQENELLQQQLSEAQSIITTIKNERHEMAEKYRTEYESALSFHFEEKNNALQKVYELEQALAIKIEELNNMSTRMRDLNQAVSLKTEELNAVNRGRQELEQAFGMKAEEASNMWMRISELEQVVVVRTEELNNAKESLKDLDYALATKSNELTNVMQTVTDLQEKLRQKEEESNNLLRELNAKSEELNRHTLRLQQLEEECQKKSASLDNAIKMNEDLVKNVEHNIPEIESLNRSLNAEKSVVEDLNRSVNEKEQLLARKDEEINFLKGLLADLEERLKEAAQKYETQLRLAEEYCDAKEKLEDLVSNLQTELQTANMELELSRKALEDLRRSKEEVITSLENKIEELSAAESRDMLAMKQELGVSAENYERLTAEKERQEALQNEEIAKLQNISRQLEAHIQTLKSELKEKDNDIFELSQTMDEEQKQLGEMRALLEVKDAEITDLKQALSTFQEEINSFRNFEKQVKELRMAQIKQTGTDVAVTSEGDPDFTNWTEHELVELNTRLQSDLDTALYMLHQRDIRCDELTFELVQLLEERDTLQLRLSTAIRINEELRSLTSNAAVSHVHDTRQDSKDLIDQSNDRQARVVAKVPEEDLQQLAQKISELHSVGYIKDKTIQDETLQRHRDQMTLLGRTSDSDLGRESQSPVVSTWIRTGKPAPKVMHI